MSAAVTQALTAQGAALKARIEMGDGAVALRITRIVAGAGVSENPLDLADMMDVRQQFTIHGASTSGGRTVIEASLTNAGLTESYSLSQIGFYAIGADGVEILYRITQLANPYPVPLPTERAWTYHPTFNIVTGNASEVIVSIALSGYALTSMIGTPNGIASLDANGKVPASELPENISGSHIIIRDTQPLSAEQAEGDIWLDTSGGWSSGGDGSGNTIIGNMLVQDFAPSNTALLWGDTTNSSSPDGGWEWPEEITGG